MTESGRERKSGRLMVRGGGLAIWGLIALAFSQCQGPHAEVIPPSSNNTACMVYHDAQQCLVAIKAAARRCIATKFGGKATPDQVLQCLGEAITQTGATRDGDLSGQ